MTNTTIKPAAIWNLHALGHSVLYNSPRSYPNHHYPTLDKEQSLYLYLLHPSHLVHSGR